MAFQDKVIQHGAFGQVNETILNFKEQLRTINETIHTKERVIKYFEGAAISSDCEMETTNGSLYTDLRPNKPLCHRFTNIMSDTSMPVFCDTEGDATFPASTDQGFHKAAGTEEAFERTLVIATGLANTAWDILTDDLLMLDMKKAFEADRVEREASGNGQDEMEKVYQWAGFDTTRKKCTCKD